MRASRVVACLLATFAALGSTLGACSLITPLAPARDTLCTPEIVTDVGDAALTSVVTDTVSNSAYFAATNNGTVYAVPLDAAAGVAATPVMQGLSAVRRLATASGSPSKDVEYTYLFATAQGVAGPGGLFMLTPDGGQQTIVSGANVHADGLFAHGVFPPALYWVDNDPGGAQIRSSAIDGATTVLAEVDAALLHDVLATDAPTLWATTKNTAEAYGFGDAGPKATPCAGVIAYAPKGLVSARVYVTSETACNGKNQIQWLPADDPYATPTAFAQDLVTSPTSMVYDGEKYLYWSNNTEGTIARRIVDGSADVELVATSPASPHQLAYSNGVLYWTTDSALVRCVIK